MELNYNKSGVKTLRTTSSIFLIVSIILSLILFVASFDKGYISTTVDWMQVTIAVIILFTGFFVFGLGYAIANISEVALMKQHAEFPEFSNERGGVSMVAGVDIDNRSIGFKVGDAIFVKTTGEKFIIKGIDTSNGVEYFYADDDSPKYTKEQLMDTHSNQANFNVGDLVIVKDDESQFRIGSVETIDNITYYSNNDGSKKSKEDQIELFDKYWANKK